MQCLAPPNTKMGIVELNVHVTSLKARPGYANVNKGSHAF